MPPRPLPVVVAAAAFVGAFALGGRSAVLPLGPALLGTALALSLGTPKARAVAAAFAGFAWACLHPAPVLTGFAPDRVALCEGVVSGHWKRDSFGASTTLSRVLVAQGGRVWVDAPDLILQLDLSVPPPATGSRIRVRGELRRSAGFANERADPPGRLRLRVKSDRLFEVVGRPGAAARLAEALHRRIAAPFDALAGQHPGIATARGVLFGDLGALPDRDRRAFRRSGLAHLLAASGMNVALAVAVCAALAVFLPRGARLAVAFAAVLAHLAVVGPEPSLARASAMALLALLALAVRRPPRASRVVALAVPALLLVDPGLLSNAGFVLSCAATTGLVLATPAAAECLRRLPRPLRLSLAASIVAQAATTPFSATLFASFSPGAIALNLVYVPLASVLLVVALAWGLAGALLPGVASVTAPVLDLLATPFGWLAGLPAGPWLSVATGGGAVDGLSAAALFLLPLVLARFPRHGVVLLLALFANGVPRPPSGEWELVQADVGQGDGALLRRGDRAFLIDGGGAASVDLAPRVWLPLLARRGITRLEALVVSHGDRDHCGGLVDVAAYVEVAALVVPAGLERSDCARELEFWTGRRPRTVAAGEALEIAGFRLAALAPERGSPAATSNGGSLVLRAEAGGRRILFTGDLDGEDELRFSARAGSAVACDVLKVGHHGSARGSREPLLAAARPRLALVSAGPGNRFGHPAAATLARLRAVGAIVLRTDRQGALILRWRDGGPIRIALPGSPREDG